MTDEIKNINRSLVEVLSYEKGYFGRVDTWDQRPTKYDYIGYELTEDFLPILEKMSDKQRKSLVMIVVHFEIHAQALKNILKAEEGEHTLYKFYSEISWSQFMTVVMFGMIELAIKGEREGWLEHKRQKVIKFMEDYLPSEVKDDIAKRYKVDEICKHGEVITTFADVIGHLWDEVRSGFIHKGGIESRGMEWSSLKGIGSKEDPITICHDVPMQELLQITWQAILNSFGYKGQLKLPKYKI